MHKLRLDKGIFSFLSKKGCNLHDMRRILKIYAEGLGLKKPNKRRTEWYVEISIKAQEDFINFKKCFYKNSTGVENARSYDEWWQERNMDGSFAYNGVTEDF